MMCAPKVIDYVNTRLSRRDLFRLAGVGAATAALPSRVRAQEGGRRLELTNLADLTHTITPTFPVFPGVEPFRQETLVTIEQDGYYANRWDIDEHTGTHLDAPAHFIAGGATADTLGLERFIAPLALVDISARAANDPDTMLTVDDLLAYEAAHGTLPTDAVVVMASGWDARAGDGATFLNTDADGVMHFPGFSPEAAEFLVSERSIAGIGVDTLSLDAGTSETFAVHVSILGAGLWGLENVANLSAVPAAGAHLVVGSLKVAGASGGPVRVMALWG